ncbi:LysR family transcriptional regulator [Novosphingobium beihaiensis]|uniref:LysR substrate-binding domain-containing protein n=1 Tax=Novosphingobium beihaiensis TaxID=2930389 RepID=A0ABT0BW21_9SPHN|nr:LysR substrate-binding domain-containing protein [Novosphingobium beihaiensis]MCJ2189001.1 LysR substrate-binding domain-containing protein [Novosphingobium beihaiensis]
MRLRHIEIFHAVYEQGSVSEAARVLNVSQPSVSKVLRHAEDQLGYDLFQRTKGRLIATEAAHELFAEVSEVYSRLGRLSRAARNIGARKGGHLRLAVLPSLGLAMAPQAVARMRHRNPEVTFEITTLHSREVERSLFERECDVAIGYRVLRQTPLRQIPLGSAGLVLVSPSGQFGPADEPVPMEALNGRDFIGLRDSGPLADVFVNELTRLAIAPHEVVTSHTYYTAMALVREGQGVTVTDAYTAAALSGPDLSYYRLDPDVSAPVNAITLENPPAAALIAQFVEAMRAVLVEAGEGGLAEKAS